MSNYDDIRDPTNSIQVVIPTKKNSEKKKRKFSLLNREKNIMRSYKFTQEAIEKTDELYKKVNEEMSINIPRVKILETLILEATPENIAEILRRKRVDK